MFLCYFRRGAHTFNPEIIVPKENRAKIIFAQKKMENIHRDEVLDEMDHREKYGNPFFSIQFYLLSGEVRILPKARACGLKFSMKENRMRGIKEVDPSGNDTGHVIPVSIDNIRIFNGKKVVL